MSLPAVPRPAAVTWFKVYAIVFVLMYLAVAAFSLFFYLGDPHELDMEPPGPAIVGSLFLVFGLIFAAGSAVPL